MKLPLAIRRGSSLLPLLASLATVLGSVSQLPWYSRPASYWELDQIELDQTELEKKCPIYGTAGPDGELIADGNAEGAIEVKVVQSPCGKAGNRRRRILEAERFIKEVFRGESPVVSEPWIPTEEGKEFGNSYTPDRKWDEGRDMTKEEKTKAHEGYCFNSWRSDSLPLVRDVPTSAVHYRCRDYSQSQSPEALAELFHGATVTIVIVFFNELYSTLVRSLVSVLNRTPDPLFDEVVLIDDTSDHSWKPELGEKLRTFVKSDTKKTKLLRLPERGGLMRARVAGARAGIGEYLVFLDSHIECRSQWLEPLLAHMLMDKRNVVTPAIEVIGNDDFHYRAGSGSGGLGVLGFTWKLGQTPVTGRGAGHGHEPAASPIMAGGLFGASRFFFLDELEGYDPEFEIYGGEEMEIGFKVWQCHGRIDHIPCSAIGHVFRTSDHWQGQVFEVPGTTIWRNKRRAAAVWMDEYKDLANIVMGGTGGRGLGDLSFPLRVREKLQCKDFHWYMQSIYPEMFVPGNLRKKLDFAKKLADYSGGGSRSTTSTSGRSSTSSSNTQYHAGSIVSAGFKSQSGCIDTLGAGAPGSPMGFYPCHGEGGSQAFLALGGQLRIGVSEFRNCVTAAKKDKKTWELQLSACSAEEEEDIQEESLDSAGESGGSRSASGAKKMSFKEKLWANPATKELLTDQIQENSNPRRPLVFIPLKESSGKEFEKQVGVFLAQGSLRCLQFANKSSPKSPFSAELVKCDVENEMQHFTWKKPGA